MLRAPPYTAALMCIAEFQSLHNRAALIYRTPLQHVNITEKSSQNTPTHTTKTLAQTAITNYLVSNDKMQKYV